MGQPAAHSFDQVGVGHATRTLGASAASSTPRATRTLARGSESLSNGSSITLPTGGSVPINGTPSNAAIRSGRPIPRLDRTTAPTGPPPREATTVRAAVIAATSARASRTMRLQDSTAACRAAVGDRPQVDHHRAHQPRHADKLRHHRGWGKRVGREERNRGPARQRFGEHARIQLAAAQPQARPPRTGDVFGAEENVDPARGCIEINQHAVAHARSAGGEHGHERARTGSAAAADHSNDRPGIRVHIARAKPTQPISDAADSDLWTDPPPVDGGIDNLRRAPIRMLDAVSQIAAFFDLDKTIIAKSSTLAFGKPFYQSGLLNRRTVLRSAYAQFVFALAGADEDQMERMRDYLTEMCTGWDVAQVREIVAETLHDIIDPIVYDEAVELIAQHKADGPRGGDRFGLR